MTYREMSGGAGHQQEGQVSNPPTHTHGLPRMGAKHDSHHPSPHLPGKEVVGGLWV